MIPYGKQKIDQDDIDSVVETLKSDYITQGPKVRELEERIAEYCGSKYAVATTNGTSALHLAYLSAGFNKGDEIITTPNTFVATTNMMLACGIKPVFCDIRLDTYNIDESKIEKLITKKTKAIVIVDFAGHPCDLDPIIELAKKYNILVIEDASHALGAEYKGKKIGSISDVTIFSFHPVKNITTAEGGMLVTNNSSIYNKALSLRSHGVSKDSNGFNVMTDFGYNYRLSDLHSALGVSQLKKLDRFTQSREEKAQIYSEKLKGVEEIILPIEDEDVRSGWHLYIIRVKEKEFRLPLYSFLKNAGIGVNFHYPAVYSHVYYRKHGYNDVALKNSDIYSDTAITIPLYVALSEEEINYIVDKIKYFFSNENL